MHCSAMLARQLADHNAGGLGELRQSLQQGLGLPVSHPTLDILMTEQAQLKVSVLLYLEQRTVHRHTYVPVYLVCIKHSE